MKRYTEEKKLIEFDENNFFYKIRKHFSNVYYKIRKLFYENKEKTNINIQNLEKNKVDSSKLDFIRNIKNIENEENRLLELQVEYSTGKIKEEDLTQKQIRELYALYDNQIEQLKKSNEIRKKRILEYKKKLEADSQID